MVLQLSEAVLHIVCVNNDAQYWLSDAKVVDLLVQPDFDLPKAVI